MRRLKVLLAFFMLSTSVAAIGVTVETPAATAQAPSDAERTFDPKPANVWGVADLDRGSDNFQYYSLVFAFTQIGDTVYSGGKFQTVTNDVTDIDQSYLAAFDQDGQSWRSNFRPTFDSSVFALETNESGNRVFVGGEFTSTNGDTNHAAFAALNPATGAIDGSFDVQVTSGGSAAPRVHDLRREGRWLYIAGAFTHVTGSDGDRVWVNNMARVDADSGIVDRSWRPRASGGSVWEITPDPARDRVLVGGTFSHINNLATQGFAIIDETDGSLEDYDRNFATTNFASGAGYIFASTIEVVGDKLVLGGQLHRTLITTADLTILSAFRTNRYNATNRGGGGDTQALTVRGNTVFVACHCWGRVWHEGTDNYYDVRSLYAIDLVTGEIVTSFAPDFSGASGPWALHIDNEQCLWVGTDAVQSGQRRSNGVIRLCERDNLVQRITTITPSDQTSLAPANMIDADRMTNWQTGHQGASSGPASQPAFDVVLDDSYDIDELVLWNRTDANRTRFQNLHVWVSSAPITETSFAALRANPAVTEVAKPGNHGAKRTLSFDVGTQGRYLRIQADHSAGAANYLDLTEIAIFGSSTATNEVSNCSVSVNGTAATITWDEVGAQNQVIYRSVNGARNYWRGRVAGSTFDDVLRAGVTHTYSVATVGPNGPGQLVGCTPGDVTIGDVSDLELVSTRQTRERIVLHWSPSDPVVISRNGIEIAQDDDGWFTDRNVSAATTYTYRAERADGTFAEITTQTMP